MVVPNLNEERYLPSFLNSLCAQSFKDFELIIIDGESVDQSVEIISSFADRLKIKLIICGERNIGYIRNLGCARAEGDILFNSSSDTVFPTGLLETISVLYKKNPNLVSLSGRTQPFGTSIISKLGYKAFDLLRFLATTSPTPIRKYRPSGNFCTIKRDIYEEIGGYPCARINEDGLLGQKIDEYLKIHAYKTVAFKLRLCVGHYVKRFEKIGGLKSLLFYSYVFGNLFPMLKPLTDRIERKSACIFASRSDLKEVKK